MKTIRQSLMTSCWAILLLSGYSTQGAGPLPEFTYKGVALHPDRLSYAPTGELEHPSLIKMEGRVKNPLGRYYLYYAPHKHVGVGVAYSDSIEGPWTEYQGNPVLEGPAAPDIRWIEEKGKFYMWGHRKNSQTELWTSDDGLHFQYKGVSVTAKNIGARNANYTRVYEYPLKQYGSKYIMLYSGFVEERGIQCVWLAHSTDAENWVQLKTPLVEPVEGENDVAYCASLLQWDSRNFIVYQDHTSWRGGNIKYVEVDRELHPVGNKGERFVLMRPPATLNDRYRSAEFYLENDTFYMYSGAGSKPRIYVYATASAVPNRSSQTGERPNIILAMADDQGWRDVAYNADPDLGLQTPNMDRMAREGIRFNRFYSGAPNCSPTRASVLTGRHPNRSGTFNPGFAMRPQELTIAEVLQKAGYATAHFGKWHLGPVKANSPMGPGAQGFDYYLSEENFFETDPKLSRNGNPPESFTGDGSEVIVEEALKYIDSIHNTGKPFLLVIWFGSPHRPHKPLQKYKDLYPDLSEEFQNYFGEMTGIDRALGTLRSGLETRGLDANTLIWYTSDNGSHKPADHITGLRGCKGSMWEGGIRVPATIVWPKCITKPMETEMYASTLDIMPTIMDLLGITLENRTLDGISLLPLLHGTDMKQRSKPLPFWRIGGTIAREERQNTPLFTKEELTGWFHDFECYDHPTPRTDDFDGWAAWIEGKWKLHKNQKGDFELYDLEADPAESIDLAPKLPEVVKDLARKLEDWQRSVEVSLTGADYDIEPTIHQK